MINLFTLFQLYIGGGGGSYFSTLSNKRSFFKNNPLINTGRRGFYFICTALLPIAAVTFPKTATSLKISAGSYIAQYLLLSSFINVWCQVLVAAALAAGISSLYRL
jgi:hypothetical protein